jgi:transcriptional regulator with GAF, ATPase, and Fis domain
MKPRLIALAGPLKGSIVEIDEDEVFIGRDRSNQLSLDDKSVSRRHAVIKRVEGEFRITDLGSHNGTLVNETTIDEQPLRQGDRIQMGSSYFLFLEENSVSLSEGVKFDNGSLVTVSKVQMKLEDVLSALARDLSILLEISARINSTKSLEALQRLLLESIFEITPAERGAVILTDGDPEHPNSVFALNRLPYNTPITISLTVAQQVMKEGVSILSNEIVAGGAFDVTESLAASRASALICVPIRFFHRTIGVIYLDTSQVGVHFTEGNLKTVTAIAGFVSGSLENVRHLEWLESEHDRLRNDIQIEHNMIGESQKMKEVYQFIAKVSPTDSTVLIGGESGTGKELAARAIHQNSPRSRKPFVAINCAALAESLLESELFGYEKGAFTGATTQKKGKLEVADSGTLFLDEVGEMPLSIQAKLLRALQEREFERVGGTRAVKVDLRVIAATNKNLEQSVASGKFRQDLYYRLNVISMTMPPLRERGEDVMLLADYFIQKYSIKCKRHVAGIVKQARSCLAAHTWPGNVRELENTIERAVVLGSTEYIQLEDLPEALLETALDAGRNGPFYYESLRKAKVRIITETLDLASGSYTEAAKILGIHPNNLHRVMRNLGLK